MKYVGTLLLCLLCIGVLVIGQMHWSNKIEQVSTITAATTNEKAPAKKNDPFSKVADHELKETLQLAAWENENGSAQILIAGSDSLGTDKEGTAALLSERLKEAYGDKVTVQHLEYKGNSVDFLANDMVKDYMDAEPDVFIYEPLLLNSNGISSAVKATPEMIDEVLEKLEAENEYMYTILTSPSPIYGATYYLREVESLKGYAEEHDITYVDHWNAWPDDQSQEILDYLNIEQSAPNDKGAEIWADEILTLFGL